MIEPKGDDRAKLNGGAIRHRLSKRYDSPRAGVSLASATQLRGAPVREAISVLVDGLSCPNTLVRRMPQSVVDPMQITGRDSVPTHVAWHLVFVWLAAKLGADGTSIKGFRQAEAWFNADSHDRKPTLSSQVLVKSLHDAERILDCIEFDSEFKHLLPYILEQHGPGSRASVMNDPSTAAARAAKRQQGVFYTPADVADYMVEHARELYKGDFHFAKTLDPACGTGVFLLAQLRAVTASQGEGFSRLNFITSCLYGLDLSDQALDAAALLLLVECLGEVIAKGIRPRVAWERIRRNLVEFDSSKVAAPSDADRPFRQHLFDDAGPNLSDLFPEAPDGFDIIVGNPPYAALENRVDYSRLTEKFAALRGVEANSRMNLFPLFVEMMWQFTQPACNAAALVTPLSIAYHSGAQYENCRRAMSGTGGQWQFAFFDREPHALFGEEVKTRNAILFRFENADTPKRGQAARIETGPLRRWTSRTRSLLFQRIDFTALDSVEMTTGIPKIGGSLQAEAFTALTGRKHRFSELAIRLRTCSPVAAVMANDTHTVFVGGTAYNFLNVYRSAKLRAGESEAHLSKSAVHCLDFETETDASAAFSILHSRLVFWLWQVLGDGFHVTSGLLRRIPFSRASFSQDEFELLSRHGAKLWETIQNHRFTSMNRGRLTLGFRPFDCQEERDTIDAILVRGASLDERFCLELRRFVRDNAVVDATDGLRKKAIIPL